MKKYISRFHYITQDLPERSHPEQVQTACEAGANWIQYRCFTKNEEAMITELNHIAAICDDWGATLIVTQHYRLLDQADVQGVYMEGNDIDLTYIRQQIGEDKTLGASAHTVEQVLALQKAGLADYCGYGPFNAAKADGKSVGFGGYRALEKHPVDLPVIAAGGIRPDDVEPLLQTGVYGIAVSSAINLSLHPAEAVKAFYRKVY